MNCRTETARVHGFSKEGPLELMRKKGKENAPGGRRGERVWACSRERAHSGYLSSRVLSVFQRKRF